MDECRGWRLSDRRRCDSWSWRVGLDIDEYSRGKIDASTAELADERQAVSDLGLI